MPQFLAPPGYLSVDQLKTRAAAADKMHGGFDFKAISQSFFISVGTPDKVANDIGEWTVRMIEDGATGTYNATGPDYPLTRERFLDECMEAAGGEGRPVWVDEEFLASRDIQLWGHLPLCAPSEAAGLVQADVSKALGAGLTFRPLTDTIRDNMQWYRERLEGTELRAGLDADRERELIEELRGRS